MLDAFLAKERISASDFAALVRPHVEAAQSGGASAAPASVVEQRGRAVVQLVVNAGEYDVFVDAMRTRRLLDMAAQLPLPEEEGGEEL